MMLYSTMLKGLYRAVYGEPPDLSGEAPGRGLVLVADGVGGLDLCATSLLYVMGSMRLPFTVKLVPWGHGFGRWHADLTNAVNRDEKARLTADEAVAFRARRPEEPLFLIGKSGGTGVIVKALERLPAETVDRVVLISSALSPDYDLSRAIEATRQGVVHFWSPLDVFVLGAGTRVFGTIDRKMSVSAGLVGFRRPHPGLRQVRWRPAMAPTGYLGGHVGPDSPAFLRKYVVPLLRREGAAEAAIHPAAQSSRRDGPPIT
jgi:pimeloyl-ACP methyl ester carboxylesterase